ncbi:MAG: 8-amino-7-oxononanoate synthase, partial [Thermosynechococcaceae cyanobacterium]
TLHRANWYRQVKSIATLPGPVVEWEGRSVLNFASNDYLGLTGDERLQKAAIAAIQKYGTGSTGSRLLSGHRPVHRALEIAIAQWKQTADAIVFSSGYAANLGTIAALVGPKDLVIGDAYNHSSLKNGAKLSGARALEYAHNQMAELQQLLEQHRSTYRRCLILTDSVFSMDGDLCPLPEILDLAATFDSMVLVDEAHGTGVLGPTGAGAIEQFGCSGKPLVHMGTLSKALGSLGGYVAGSAPLIDYLRNRAASWIYTTALSPADTAAALAAIQIIQSEPERRQQLWERVAQLKHQLALALTHGDRFTVLPSASPIVCLQLPNPEIALQASEFFAAQGIYAPAIRPPTVPTSRIRVSVMATHSPEHIAQLVEAIAQLSQPH